MDYKNVVLALLLVPMAAATPGLFDEPKEQGLEAAMENVQCRVQFTIAVMESQMELLGDDDLQDDVDALEEDLEELQDLADSGDARGFSIYLRETHSGNMQDARQNALQQRNQGSMTMQVRKELRDAYSEAREDFDRCNNESLANFGEAKLEGYKTIVERLEERADNLSAKGLDTSGLEELIDDVEEQVIEPLEDALDDADTAEEVREALGDYCMFNGCKGGLNFHMAAKWHIEKLDQILELVEDDSEDAGLGDEWDTAKDYVSDADSALDSVGDGQYGGSEHDDVWDNIESASDELKDIISALRSG
jgi:hypothetical protein